MRLRGPRGPKHPREDVHPAHCAGEGASSGGGRELAGKEAGSEATPPSLLTCGLCSHQCPVEHESSASDPVFSSEKWDAYLLWQKPAVRLKRGNGAKVCHGISSHTSICRLVIRHLSAYLFTASSPPLPTPQHQTAVSQRCLLTHRRAQQPPWVWRWRPPSTMPSWSI